MNPLLLAILGGPAAMLVPFLLAARSAESHANQTAEDIAALADVLPAAVETAPVRRPKELTAR